MFAIPVITTEPNPLVTAPRVIGKILLVIKPILFNAVVPITLVG